MARNASAAACSPTVTPLLVPAIQAASWQRYAVIYEITPQRVYVRATIEDALVRGGYCDEQRKEAREQPCDELDELQPVDARWCSPGAADERHVKKSGADQ